LQNLTKALGTKPSHW